jgi:large subunit ribosomal protein L25
MTIELKASARQIPTPAIQKTRKNGQITAEVYGHKQKNLHILIDAVAFDKIFASAGESSLVDLAIDEQKPIKILIRDTQINPVTGRVIHVDLQQVRMDEVIEAKLSLNFIGEPKAVKELGGTLVKALEELDISCLPGDLIPDFEINVEGLATFEDVIRVKDLQIPKGIKVLNDPEDAVVMVEPVHEEKPEPVVVAPVAEGEEAPAAEGEADAKKEGEAPEKKEAKKEK